MTLGEERFYEALWHAAESGDGQQSKIFCLGYDRLAHLARLDEKSVRQLIPRLAAKKILDIVAAENSSIRLGKTYRIFSYEAILERQRSAGLEFVIKRGRAVEFVWPAGPDGQPPENIQTPTEGNSPTVDTTLASSVLAALATYGTPDGDAVRSIIANSRRAAPDATAGEIVHFIHEKGRAAKGGRIANPLAYLVVYVPKCFEPEILRQHRQQLQAEQARRDAELQLLRAEWRRCLTDPAVGEDDKAWARKMLAEGS
jgi:hypothetical protein